MRKIAVMVLAAGALQGEEQACEPAQMERQVRVVLEEAARLRAQQDPAFLEYYAEDEYSFPGEAWVFSGKDRTRRRGEDMTAASRRKESWHLELRQFRVKVSCQWAWAAGFIHVDRLDSSGTPTHGADWRLTAVLERRHSKWVIVHQHSSRPVDDVSQWWKPVRTRDEPASPR